MVATAVAGALGGLSANNLGAAAGGAMAPYIANAIKKATTTYNADGTENTNLLANTMAHALAGAVLSQLAGNNAVAGASGAAAGELAARAIVAAMYPGKNPGDLTENDKETVSALSQLAASLASGIASDSTDGAISGAGAGKNAVENNSLGSVLAAANKQKPGTTANYESGTQEAIREACSGGTPISCETAMAAVGSALAWPLLPGAAATTSLIGAGANAGVGYLINGEVNPNDVILGYWTGALTAGTGLWGTMGVNAGSGTTSSWLKGDDPLKGGVISGAASGLGYGVGKLTQGQLDRVLNPNWKNWEWIDVGMGISKPMPLDPLPGITGNVIGSGATEFTNDQVGKKTDEIGGKK